MYEEDQADEITLFAIETDELPVYKKEWFNKAVYVPFEHIELPVPCNYDEVLKVEYGDYMIPKQGSAAHNYPFYGSMEDELVKQIRSSGFKGTVEEFCELGAKGELFVV